MINQNPMNYVRAKKGLGQHFLKDRNIARKIVDNLGAEESDQILEVGPGMGILTHYLIKRYSNRLKLIEIDAESVIYLEQNFPELRGDIIHADFLKVDLSAIFNGHFVLIGNFPYNITSQIFFKILEYREFITLALGMVQKEVAERICAPPGSRTYGILSVLLQSFYTTEYLFSVSRDVFVPPPNVRSAVIRLERNKVKRLDCNEKLFFQVVKAAFNHRRKMLRNSLGQVYGDIPVEFQQLRPEQLSVSQFILLTRHIESAMT